MLHGPTFTGRYYRYSNLLMVVARLLEATVESTHTGDLIDGEHSPPKVSYRPIHLQ